MSEEEYVVEKIVGKRYKGDTIEYRVKWEGYSEEENTWEPCESLNHLKEMIEDFEREESLKTKTLKKYHIIRADSNKPDKSAAGNGKYYLFRKTS
jgi:hypothetical protein